MKQNRFEQILEYLCSGIMSKSEKQSVRDELFDHLMSKYETNLAIGMDEESAINKAIEELGDASTLRFKLSQVHSYAPKPTLKKAMNLLIFGCILSILRLPVLTELIEIIRLFGLIVMLVALFCLRTSELKLKYAFYIKISVFVINVISNTVSPVYFNEFEISIPFEITIESS